MPYIMFFIWWLWY